MYLQEMQHTMVGHHEGHTDLGLSKWVSLLGFIREFLKDFPI